MILTNDVHRQYEIRKAMQSNTFDDNQTHMCCLMTQTFIIQMDQTIRCSNIYIDIDMSEG